MKRRKMTTLYRMVPLAAMIAMIVLVPIPTAGQDESQQQPFGGQYPEFTNNPKFARSWWQFQQRTLGLPDVPSGAKERALQSSERNDDNGLEDLAWVNIGPAPILGGQIGTVGKTRSVSGRVNTIAVDPRHPNHWLIGAANGGVWKTEDNGVSWEPRTDRQASLAMGAIAFAPGHPTIVYAGTGEANFSGDSYAGAGLLKSTNQGNTWTLLASETFAHTSFSVIVVDPSDADVLVATTTYGFAGRAAVFFPTPLPPTGIFRSTDGGATWSQRLNAVGTDLVADPGNFLHQYAGMGTPLASSNSGVWRSRDGGMTWTPITGPWSATPSGVGVVKLAIAPSDPNVVYVSIQATFGGGVGVGGGLLGLFKTNNAWAGTPTWTQINVAATDNGTGLLGYCGWDAAFHIPARQCWYSHVISVDPADPNTLYAGGVNLWRFNGSSWTEISKAPTDPQHGIHADQHELTWVGGRLVVGNDGGVWSTTDGGATWNDHNTTLSITQFYDGSIHPINPNFALAGSQDNGTETFTGSPAWQFIFGGDGADNAISSTNPDTHWAISAQNLFILRTKNAGATLQFAGNGINFSGAPFISRFEKCPANDDVFIAGTVRVWRSNNFFTGVFATWFDNLGVSLGSGIAGMAFAPSDTRCETYAIGTDAGTLRWTANGGVLWSNLDPANAVPKRAVTDLAFDPTNPNMLYLTLSGFDEGTPGHPGHVFKTTNARAPTPTWVNVSPPVNIPHNTIVIDPNNPSVLYVGTDLGVWRSASGGASWAHMGPKSGMPNVPVFEIQASGNNIVAFTHGRGAFQLTVGTAENDESE